MISKAWFPLGAMTRWEIPPVGALIAYQRRVWRLREVNEIPEVDWNNEDRRPSRVWVPVMVVIRPVEVAGDDPKLRRHDRNLRPRRGSSWFVYPSEHYPVCVSCREPMPCREQEAIDCAQVAAREMSRFEVPGVCPACLEPVTGRQKSRTFEENVRVPLGPPVTFHSRGRCYGGLWAFEDLWVARDPGRRVSSRPPVCRGDVVVHVGTGTYECSEGLLCPGAVYDHRWVRACGCPGHPGGFSQADLVGARNLAVVGDV